MAVQLILQFPGMGQDKYDEVMAYLSLSTPTVTDAVDDWPDGIISHVAGPTEDGWCVVDVWTSREAFDAFGQTLLPAMEKAGLSLPEIVACEVYNTYQSGEAAS